MSLRVEPCNGPDPLHGAGTLARRAARERRLALGDVGQALLRTVRERPGIHFRALARAAGVTSGGQLRHHLDRLERQGLVIEVKDGRFSRFFTAAGHDPRLRAGMARFARPIPKLIAKLLLARPMTRTELRRRLGCADSTLGYHLTRLLAAGDLTRLPGRQGGPYALADQAAVHRTILLLQQGERPLPAPADGPAEPQTTLPPSFPALAGLPGASAGVPAGAAPGAALASVATAAPAAAAAGA